ncbi:SUN domain-containing protein 2-like [Dermacentor silvarum]|uniref:SUN domain-containing protein 2-like n=1 Tax=Dermacentor silvarum TaxID=543639 RepID=UPI0021014E59|nr:SUN domain-containing protein 2-like [Dermacentor silvarum]
MRKLSARWVPRLLTPDNKRICETTSEQCLKLFKRNPKEFLRRFVTIDETWIHWYIPETKEQSEQWTVPGEPAPKAKTVASAGKVMATIFVDYLEKGKMDDPAATQAPGRVAVCAGDAAAAWLGCSTRRATDPVPLASVQPTLASAGNHIYEVAAGASKAVGGAMASFSFPPAWLSWGSTSGSSLPPPPAVPVELKKQLAESELLSDERIDAHVEKALKRLALQFPTSHRDDEGATARSREEVEQLKLQLEAHRITVERLVHRLEDQKDCCQDVAALLAGLDTKIIDKVLEVMNDTSAAAPRSRLQRWLTEEMDRREGNFGANLDARLRTRLDEHRSSVQAEVAAAARQASEAREAALEARKVAQEAVEEARRVPRVVTPSTAGTTDVNEVTRVVKDMLAKYDADKTGLPDYALESAGGSVVNTRCTDTYSERAPKYYMFGLPLWTFSRTAREAITPGMHPGECWAFRGSQGHLVVKLAQRIRVKAFSVEHIPRSLVSSGHTSSAPKDFQMWGLDSETDSPGRLLGSYTYDAEGDALQHFIVQDPEAAVYEYVEMKILSNHGNLEYTCLYRVRIHGEPMS